MKKEKSFYDILDYCYLKNYSEWVNVIDVYGETYRFDGTEDSFICPYCKEEITQRVCDDFELTPDNEMDSYFYCPKCHKSI